MKKQIFISALVGSIVLLIWTSVLNVVFGFNARLTMKEVPNEREVYAVLKGTVTEPGRYLCNPALTNDGRFPDNEPVFGIQYSGVGHEAAGLGELFGLLEFLIIPLVGAWVLSRTTDAFRSRFVNRVGLFCMLGVLQAVAADLHAFGIGGSPLAVASLLAGRTMVSWTLVGIATAWIMRPVRTVE
jgi:hypothetical protein